MIAELSLLRVERTYPAAEPVRALKPTDLEIRPSELVGVIGRSGSGKSTLLNIIGLLDQPTSGTYTIRGIDVGELREVDRTALRASQFGFVFQRFHLLEDRTAIENVELGLLYRALPPRQRRARATEAMHQVELGHRLRAWPATMSGGERQRVAIARALAQSPRVLLCDEPTGNLDQTSSDVIMELLRGLHADGLTVIIVTHDRDIAASLPRCLEVADGVITERDLAARSAW